MLTADRYLEGIEKVHADLEKGGWCYHPVLYSENASINLWVLAVVVASHDCYYPLSEDYFMGSYEEILQKAQEFNKGRLGLDPQAAARIVAASMFKARKGR